MTRPQIKDAIKEDIKHVIEELWGVEPEDIPYKIFTREVKLGIDDCLALPKEELHKILCRIESGDAVHLNSVDTSRIRTLLYYKINLSDQGFHPDYGSFRFVSIAPHNHNVFRTHPDNLAMLSHVGCIKVTTPLSLFPSTVPAHQLTPDEMFKKITKRDPSLFSNFKDENF